MVLADILLVDDNQIDWEIFQEALRETAPTIRSHWVESGEEAIRFLRQEAEYAGMGPVKLVVLDLNMPGLDGFETLRKIRGTPQMSRVPVLLFSSTKSPRDIDKAYSLGANAVFSKPYSLERYVEKVRVMVQHWLQLVELPTPLRAER